MDFMQGKSSPYVEKLQFNPKSAAADPDQPAKSQATMKKKKTMKEDEKGTEKTK
jgi:hypothetical protein